jgi:hypothetical protein
VSSRTTVLRPELRRVVVMAAYGERDVEQAAERFGVTLSDEETEAILCDVDDRLDDLASAATRGAIESRIVADLDRVSRAHAVDLDD